MSFGDILVAKGIASKEDIARALEHQKANGGRIGESLVALGIVSQEQVSSVIGEVPPMPLTIEDTDIDPAFLLQLLLKGMFLERMEVPSQLAEALRLPGSIINKLFMDAKDRKLVEAIGAATGGTGVIPEMRHALTKAGRDWTQEAIDNSQYFGPAPVSLNAWRTASNGSASPTNHWPRPIDEAFIDLVMSGALRAPARARPSMPARSILIYGPPGNGKTSVAEISAASSTTSFTFPIVSRLKARSCEVYDPGIHQLAQSHRLPTKAVWREDLDRRWVACRRPFIVTGGELTLEMLDLSFNALARFYEAPLHVKALGGIFVIDDFGRQMVTPEALLNRWIVPLESRIEYLKPHTGKSFSLPFDELVVFSTNLSPRDLMDQAFLRRIPYKLEVTGPCRKTSRKSSR